MTYFKNKAFCTSNDCVHFPKCDESLNSKNIEEANTWARKVRLVAPPVKKSNMSKTCEFYVKRNKK